MILALIGYKRTGKDTLVKILNREISDFKNWIIFSGGDKFPHYDQWIRLASADSLKNEICKLHSIEYNENNKDKKIIKINSELYSFRDLCINYAKNNEDKLKWVKNVCSIVDCNRSYIITDLRFYHELNYLKSFCNQNNIEFKTARLYDSDIIDNNLSNQSEHELDSEKTDYLLLRKRSELSFFEQYYDFGEIGTI